MVPTALVGTLGGERPYKTSDTVFSEYETHNGALILSKSGSSYIIGNRQSYDKRQYPLFNIVDPEATANNAVLLREMQEHFIRFWKENDGPSKLLSRTRKTFDNQNTVLMDKDKIDESRSMITRLQADFETLSEEFKKLEVTDFEYAFHPFPENSVGHLHMHVFPRKESLRKWSARQHDRKTVPLEAVLAVEREDGKRMPRRG